MDSFIQHAINVRKKHKLKGGVTLAPDDPIMIELMTFPFEFESLHTTQYRKKVKTHD